MDNKELDNGKIIEFECNIKKCSAIIILNTNRIEICPECNQAYKYSSEHNKVFLVSRATELKDSEIKFTIIDPKKRSDINKNNPFPLLISKVEESISVHQVDEDNYTIKGLANNKEVNYAYIEFNFSKDPNRKNGVEIKHIITVLKERILQTYEDTFNREKVIFFLDESLLKLKDSKKNT